MITWPAYSSISVALSPVLRFIINPIMSLKVAFLFNFHSTKVRSLLAGTYLFLESNDLDRLLIDLDNITLCQAGHPLISWVVLQRGEKELFHTDFRVERDATLVDVFVSSRP